MNDWAMLPREESHRMIKDLIYDLYTKAPFPPELEKASQVIP